MKTTVCCIQSGQAERVLNVSMGRQSVNSRTSRTIEMIGIGILAVRKPIDDYRAIDRTGVFKIENRAGDVGATATLHLY